LLAMFLSACLDPQVYTCSEHGQCSLAGHDPGRCVGGFCAYPDLECESGYKYGPSADAWSGTCVGAAGESSTDTETFADETTEGVDTGTGEECVTDCTAPPSACFEPSGSCDPTSGTCVHSPRPAGTPCGGDDDPCFGAGTCDGEGSCDGEPVVCDAPTGACFQTEGTCNPATGTCTYAPLTEGSPCDDGDACTVGDACDGAGVCVPGPVCPTDNPCEAAQCEGGTCVYDALSDGSSCGPLAADRCCGGVCVDISADDAHCGGCFAACVPSQSCESIAVTMTCASNSPDTSGRCTCAANAECPFGQICRTATPYSWRCAPESGSACAGEFFALAQCPNYCGY
jgi:hypothetical protein